jgi:hypothetical protein
VGLKRVESLGKKMWEEEVIDTRKKSSSGTGKKMRGRRMPERRTQGRRGR